MQASVDHLLSQARERFEMQEYYGSIHLLQEIVDSGRSFADVYHLMGLSYSLLGQPERALGEFDRALAQNPRYMEAHIHRGLVLNEMGRTAEAAASFRNATLHGQPAIGGFAAPVAAKLANQHANLGEGYAEAGALREAIGQFRRAVELGPGFHDLRYRLARLLLEANNPLEAREELERIVAVQPDFVDAQAALGLALYLSGDPAAAQDVWARCLARRPGNVRVSAYLAMAQRQTP